MESVLAEVQVVFREAFGTDSQVISLETNPGDVPAWDSVGHLDLASRLEQVFNVSFDVDDLMEMENVREIVRIIDAKLKRRAVGNDG
jgi:acyl carrier protein